MQGAAFRALVNNVSTNFSDWPNHLLHMSEHFTLKNVTPVSQEAKVVMMADMIRLLPTPGKPTV